MIPLLVTLSILFPGGPALNPCTGPVWFTIDDGPDPRATPHLLRLFRQHNTRATWFVLGKMVKHGLIRAIAREGHTLANHLWSHTSPCDLGVDGVLAELSATERAVKPLAGKQWRRWYRPPNGIRCGLGPVVRRGYLPVFWHISDIGLTGEAMWARLWKRTSRGLPTIVILHIRWWRLGTIYRLAAERGCHRFLERSL